MLAGILAGLISMAGWGTGDFALSYPAKKYGSLTTLFYTQAATLVVTFALFLASYEKIVLGWADLALLFILGAVDLAAYLGFLGGIRNGELSIVAPIGNSYAIVTVLLSIIFLGESITLVKILSLALAILGIILVSTDLRKLKHIHTVKGVLPALVAMVGWGTYVFLAGFIESRIGWKQTFLMTSMMITLFSFLAFLTLKKKRAPELKDLRLFGLIGIIFSISWFSMNYGFMLTDVSIVSMISSMSPLVTTILAVTILKEKLQKNQVIGIILIISALALISLGG